MAVYKDQKHNTWFVQLAYKAWTGETKHTTKRGFSTKREALQWEHDFLSKVRESTDMLLKDFAEIYLNNRTERVRESTMETKRNIVMNHIVPYFGDKKLIDITTQDVMNWQNEIMRTKNPRTGRSFTKSYLKTIHNQLSAMLNHAVKYYDLPKNVAMLVGNMGTDKEVEMQFWTIDEYKKFAEQTMRNPLMYYCFEVLYWCGIREGELLALTLNDIDFEKKLIDINKTFKHINGRDYTTDPKTRKSKRKVLMPDFLVDELKEYIKMVYELDPTDRLFPTTKSGLTNAMIRYSAAAGVKRIRIHDLRHSHVSLLIDMGYSAVAIADRVGHESVEITYRYAHMFPDVQASMADKLGNIKRGDE